MWTLRYKAEVILWVERIWKVNHFSSAVMKTKIIKKVLLLMKHMLKTVEWLITLVRGGWRICFLILPREYQHHQLLIRTLLCDRSSGQGSQELVHSNTSWPLHLLRLSTTTFPSAHCCYSCSCQRGLSFKANHKNTFLVACLSVFRPQTWQPGSSSSS